MTTVTALPDTDPTTLAQVAERAEHVCIVFHQHPLPAGCRPPSGRIGVEIDPGSGRALLHVDRTTQYSGRDGEVAGWVASGTRSFPRFDQLITWLRDRLRAVPAAPDAHDPASSATKLTDLDAVVRATSEHTPTDLDAAPLAERLSGEIVGQRRAVDVVSRAAARHVSRTEPLRPLTLLFIGPTGVGKTHTASQLAAALGELTDEPWPFTRLDMTEFSEAHSVSKLHGSPPGYIGYRDGNQLTDILAREPRSVILFDEIEKAHRNVLLALMNLMDAGRLTGARNSNDGPDARRAILVFTTNLDASGVLADVADLDDDAEQVEVDEVCRQRLRSLGLPAELVARFTHHCVFEPLDVRARAEVTTLSIVRTAATYGVDVVRIDPQLVARMLRRVDDLASGVRALEYVVDADLGELFVAARRNGTTTIELVDGEPPEVRPAPRPDQAPAGPAQPVAPRPDETPAA